MLNKISSDMKKIVNFLTPALSVAAIVFSVAAFSTTCAATHANGNAAPETAAAASLPAAQPVDLTYAADKALPSVVHIKYVQNSKVQTVEVQSDPFEDFFSDPFGGFFGRGQRGQGGTQKRKVQTPKKTATGSGVIISADGYIVTNNHVVDGADELTVTLSDNQEYSARIIGADKTTDLALIKIDGKQLPAIKIANSDNVKVGEWVLAIGNPLGLNNTVTAGIISAKARTLGANGVESFIQTDAAINAGNSGGALVNAQGELVGINSMIYSQTGSYAGYGFAIPTTIMNKVVDDLKVYGTVQRAILGVQGQDVDKYIDVQKAKGETPDLGTVKGVYIVKISDGSAAEEAELEKGDIITKIDDKEVTKMSELQEQIAQHKPGDKVKITYIRNKKTKTETITLRNSQGNTKVMTEVDLDQLGVSLKPVSEEEMKSLGIDYGLSINAIRRGKMMEAGATKGTILLEVNDEKMESVEDWESVVKAANQSSDRALWIKALKPSGRKVSFVVDLNE